MRNKYYQIGPSTVVQDNKVIIQMENRIYKTKTPVISRSQSSTRIKFKQIHPQPEFNQLNSKYQLYRQGSPNVYQQDLGALKANNIKGQVSMLQVPAVDYIITQISQADKEKHANQRNYELYPSLLKSNNHVRYKQMLSEKQQVKDFVIWFEGQFQQIQESRDSPIKKFQDKQTLIAAGFTEMTGQVAKITKNRAELLKMLWNREHEEVKNIIQSLNGLSIKKERNLLEQISSIHKEYQDQIEQLRKINADLSQKYFQQQKFSRGCVQDLRRTKKRLKKSQYLNRKLCETNGNHKTENMHLLEENIRLMASIKEITLEQSAVLNYRRLQLHEVKKHNKNIKYKELLALTQPENEDSLTPLLDLDFKKNALYEYFLERMRQHPDQKQFIREQYFPDEQSNHTRIDQYFQKVINRPNVQIQLLTEGGYNQVTKNCGVNTDDFEQQIEDFILSLDKGIQVNLTEGATIRGSGHFSSQGSQIHKNEIRMFHVIHKKQQEQKEKESKMRIIQHRLSRRNSLTLLQLHNLGDLGKNKGDRRPTASPLSNKPGINKTHAQGRSQLSYDFHGDISKGTIISQDQNSQKSESQTSEKLLLDDISVQSGLTTIKVRGPASKIVRKSANFQTMLRHIDNSLEQKISIEQTKNNEIIQLDGEQQESIKVSQLDDLITKHLQKGGAFIGRQGLQKNLNKVLMNLFRNAWNKNNINMKLQLLDVVKQSYGNVKSVLSKFLYVVGVIRHNENYSAFLKIISLLLKINTAYVGYNEVNTTEVADLYFRLYGQLTIKTIQESSFNIWKACTTMDRIKTLDFMETLQCFFSEKKRRYVEAKIAEQMAASQVELRNKKNSTNSSNKRIQIVNEEAKIIKLNPLLLYIVEVYLIEKQLYHSSYSQFVDFISQDGVIQGQLFIWLLQMLYFTEEQQKKIIDFALPQRRKDSKQKKQQKQQTEKHQKHVKDDMWYRCCVKFDFPIMEQLSISTYSQMKLLPSEIQQNYYRMIGLEEWSQIKQNLFGKYMLICESSVYFKAFTLIAEKLEHEILKGVSIYGGPDNFEKAKRKEEVFSLFYRILIVEAHRNLIGQDIGQEQLGNNAIVRQSQ